MPATLLPNDVAPRVVNGVPLKAFTLSEVLKDDNRLMHEHYVVSVL